MAGMMDDALARQRVQQLLREGEEQRRGAGLRADRPRASRLLRSLLGRRRARDASVDEDRASSATIEHVVLDDGRNVCFRPLRNADRAIYRDAVAGLSPRSRYLRFAAPIPTMSESLLNQMMAFDGDRHVVYAALTPDETTIVGVARFIRAAGDPQSAEVAIAIADEWQGGGLGSQLMAKVIEHARATDVNRLVATTLSENRVAARLASASGFSVARRAGIYDEYEMPLRAVSDRSFSLRERDDASACTASRPARRDSRSDFDDAQARRSAPAVVVASRDPGDGRCR